MDVEKRETCFKSFVCAVSLRVRISIWAVGARGREIDRRKLKGRWTKEEHDSFLIGLRDRGKDWEAIERDYVPTRSGTQIRTHAQKYFRKFEQGLPFPDEVRESRRAFVLLPPTRFA